jgi:hypothetical protein
VPRGSRDLTVEERFAKVVAALRRHKGVTAPSSSTGKFGSSALRVRGKIFAMVSSRGEFVVKLPAPRIDVLIGTGDGDRFDPGRGRIMREWLVVARTSKTPWLRLAKEAMAFVSGIRQWRDSPPR